MKVYLLLCFINVDAGGSDEIKYIWQIFFFKLKQFPDVLMKYLWYALQSCLYTPDCIELWPNYPVMWPMGLRVFEAHIFLKLHSAMLQNGGTRDAWWKKPTSYYFKPGRKIELCGWVALSVKLRCRSSVQNCCPAGLKELRASRWLKKLVELLASLPGGGLC